MKRRLVQIAITAALLALVAWFVDERGVLALLGRIEPVHGISALALLFLQNDLITRRWTTMLRAFVIPPSHFQMLRYQYAALFAQLFLPTSIGGAAVRIGVLYRSGVAIGVAVNSVVLDRLVASAGLILLATVFLPIAALPFSLGKGAKEAGVIGFLIMLAIVAIGYPVLKWRPVSYWLSLLNRTPARHLVQPAMAAAHELTRPGRVMSAFGYSLAGQVVTIVAVFTLARGMGLNVNLIDCVLVMPPVMLLSSLPISIAGWGVRESAMIIAFGLLGVPREAALALSLQFAVLGYVSATPGALAWLSGANRAMFSKPAVRRNHENTTGT